MTQDRITKEFVDTLEEHMLRYAGTTKLRNVSAQHILDDLRFQLKPECPCPLCDEEMVRGNSHPSCYYVRCHNKDCLMGPTKSFESIVELKKALNG